MQLLWIAICSVLLRLVWHLSIPHYSMVGD